MGLLSTSEARENFSDIVNTVAFGKERQIVSRRGKELVAIIPIEELRWLEKFEDYIDLKDAKAELETIIENGFESWNAVKKELGL
jgi:prevent-host-death family protein